MAATSTRRSPAPSPYPPAAGRPRRTARLPRALAVALALAACSDERTAAEAAPTDALASDSALARDLTLAGTPPAPDAPVTFNDTATLDPGGRDSIAEPAVRAERPTVATAPRRAPRRTTASRRDSAGEPAVAAVAAVPVRREPPATPGGGVTPPESSAVEPAIAGARRGRAAIGAGSMLSFTTTARICTSSNAPGDKIVGTLDAPATGTDGFTLPAGTTKAVLEMASVERDAEGNPTTITFRVRNLDDGSSTYKAAGEVTTVDSLRRTRAKNNPSADRRKVVGGAVLGAVLGQVIGKDTKGTVIGAAAGGAAGAVTAARGAKYEGCLPEGAKVTLRLAEPIVQ